MGGDGQPLAGVSLGRGPAAALAQSLGPHLCLGPPVHTLPGPPQETRSLLAKCLRTAHKKLMHYGLVAQIMVYMVPLMVGGAAVEADALAGLAGRWQVEQVAG